MDKNYRTFVEDLRQRLLEDMSMKAEQIFFEEKGGRYTQTGDRLFVECAAYQGAREICGIFTDELYKRYSREQDMDGIVEDVKREVECVRKYGFFEKTKNLMEYEKVKKDLFVRLVNRDRNAADLQNAVYRVMGDVALVLYMKLGESKGCITSIKIRQEYIDVWNIGEELVFDAALRNTYFLSPPRLYRWDRMARSADYEGENFMDAASELKLNQDARGNCISTVKKTNGAVAIFLPGVAKRLGELLGYDYYVVFSSIHEVMIHNDKSVGVETLEEILQQTVKVATPDEDFLSYQIFHYSRETGKFCRVL